MKKFTIIAGATLVLLGVLIAILTIKENRENAPYQVKISEKSEVQAAFDQEDTFLLVIGATTCPSCNSYRKGTLIEFNKKGPEVDLYYLFSDTSFTGSTDLNNFLIANGLTLGGTPTTYFVRDGQLMGTDMGDISYDELVSQIATYIGS